MALLHVSQPFSKVCVRVNANFIVNWCIANVQDRRGIVVLPRDH